MRNIRCYIDLAEVYLDAFRVIIATYGALWSSRFREELSLRTHEFNIRGFRRVARELRGRLEERIVAQTKNPVLRNPSEEANSDRIWSLFSWDIDILVKDEGDVQLLHEVFSSDFKDFLEEPEKILIQLLVSSEELARKFHKLTNIPQMEDALQNSFERKPSLHVREIHRRTSIPDIFTELNSATSVDGVEAYHELLRTNISSNKIYYWFGVSGMTNTIFLALPFLLMHEFLSHVYTVDEGPGKVQIISRVFLEGWMDHALLTYIRQYRDMTESVGNEFSNKLEHWDDRVFEFETLILKRRMNSPTIIQKGHFCAAFVHRNIGWIKFVTLTQQLLCWPSDPEDMGDKVNLLNPVPMKGLHEDFMDIIDILRKRQEDEVIKEIGSQANSLPDWWVAIHNKINK